MTIEEVEDLRIQEMNNELRFPKLEIEYREINKVLLIQDLIYHIINNKFFVSKLLNKLRLKKMGFEISGQGTDEKPYQLKSYFGEGKYFNIKYIFNDKKCPFKVGACFSNAFNMAGEMYKLPDVEHCDCVSGIALTMGKNGWRRILHSVVEINDMVIDVNLKMVISKDLYYKLFMFEELARFQGSKAEEMLEVLKKDETRKITKQFNLKTYHMVFALDDIKDFIQNEERRTGHEVFQELNY